MAVLRNALKTDSTKAKTRRTTKSKGGKRVRREILSRKDGAERLRQAADKRLNEISEQLADLLKKKALDGDLASAKTLIGLAAAKKPIPEPVKKQPEPSYADKLAKEPQWPVEAEVEGMEGWDGRPF
jgi:DNA polymerase III gamma/tau subunit